MANYVLAKGVGAPINKFGGKLYINKTDVTISLSTIASGNTFDVLYLPENFLVLGAVVKVTQGSGGTVTFTAGTDVDASSILSSFSVAGAGEFISSPVLKKGSTIRLACSAATSPASDVKLSITIMGILLE